MKKRTNKSLKLVQKMKIVSLLNIEGSKAFYTKCTKLFKRVNILELYLGNYHYFIQTMLEHFP